jgi:hypothetical protein
MSANQDQPKSLGDYHVPSEREALIKTHIAMLSETARGVSDQLAFGADVSELSGVLETNADDNGKETR